jgi:hypothetical protein
MMMDIETWCRQHRRDLEEQLQALEAGKFELFEIQNGTHIDISGEAVARIKRQIQELDDILSRP